MAVSVRILKNGLLETQCVHGHGARRPPGRAQTGGKHGYGEDRHGDKIETDIACFDTEEIFCHEGCEVPGGKPTQDEPKR